MNITRSTISGNYSAGNIGGMLILGSGTDTATIRESTISGNRSGTGVVGGMYVVMPSTTLANDTIAFNVAALQTGGLSPGAAFSGGALTLQSTLIADNYSGNIPSAGDLSVSGTTVTGANNLVRASTVSLPAGTIRNTCPLLGSLRKNGGATETHALLSRSRGIDEGANPNGDGQDQRGPLLGDSTRALPAIVRRITRHRRIRSATGRHHLRRELRRLRRRRVLATHRPHRNCDAVFAPKLAAATINNSVDGPPRGKITP